MKTFLAAAVLTAAMTAPAWADRLESGVYLIPVFLLPDGEVSVRSDLARKQPDAETCEMRMRFASKQPPPPPLRAIMWGCVEVSAE